LLIKTAAVGAEIRRFTVDFPGYIALAGVARGYNA
jgi:hypothetical protein